MIFEREFEFDEVIILADIELSSSHYDEYECFWTEYKVYDEDGTLITDLSLSEIKTVEKFLDNKVNWIAPELAQEYHEFRGDRYDIDMDR